jgi:hypothetical protein
LTIFNNLLQRYENQITQGESSNEIIELEKNSEFIYFADFFETLFTIKNLDHKIIKCYFEIKNCFNKLDLIYEGFKIIERCYLSYKSNIAVVFELLKQSVIVSIWAYINNDFYLFRFQILFV